MNSPMNRRALWFFVLLAAATLLPVRADAAAGGATISFRKVFKMSSPEFVEIKVSESGATTCDIRQLDEEPSPQPLEIGAPVVQRIFSLAGKLHNFNGLDLEMHRRIANLGEKTFRYERGAEMHSVTFNFTLDDSARQLLDIFEGLARQQTDLSDLQRAMRYDRLGVNDAVRQIDADYTRNLLPDPARLLPALDQVAADQRFIDIARDRARALATRIRASSK
jgi:hypothetical protein